ncbi:hypothetical protein B0H19DRAFT_1083038 [Mycena capillaripes]|nr:hypothetical protein B0H19DRAFT_1083038 [Mycena capillaripes]
MAVFTLLYFPIAVASCIKGGPKRQAAAFFPPGQLEDGIIRLVCTRNGVTASTCFLIGSVSSLRSHIARHQEGLRDLLIELIVTQDESVVASIITLDSVWYKNCVRFGVRTLLNAEPNALNLNARFRFKVQHLPEPNAGFRFGVQSKVP